VPAAKGADVVLVVDVTSFTAEGFVGSSAFDGDVLNIQFDDKGEGVFLTSEMATRLAVRKGSRLNITVEGETNQVSSATVSGLSKMTRISDPKLYYGVGKEGGAIIRVRKA
jgi:hypothetical protein